MSNDVLCGYFAVKDLHEFPPSPSESPPTVKYNVLAKNRLNRLYAIITVASATIGISTWMFLEIEAVSMSIWIIWALGANS